MLEILKRIGLSDAELLIYEALLNYGELSAGQIIEKTKLKRGDSYNKIYDLIKKGLVEEFNKGKIKGFRLEHPNKVQEYIEKRENELEATRREVAAIMPNLVSTFNLAYHKPGVKYFEGMDGLKNLMHDSLKAQTEILSYVDLEAVSKIIPDLNQWYVKQRAKRGVGKRIIVTDSIKNREFFDKLAKEVTDVRYLSFRLPNFQTVMQIYDNKVTYQTLKENAMIGVVIEDSSISSMHKGLFEFTWSMAEAK